MDVYLATVCLDRNRWGSREPSFAVSEWLPQFVKDGFDGIELWEFHYLAADAAEQARLATLAAPVAVFNSYAAFTDEAGQGRERAAAAVTRLKAGAVKYNLGGDANRRDEYLKNLLAWSRTLPESCRLLCECHPGTILEQPEAAAAYFADLESSRHGAICHISGDPAAVETWFSMLGSRIAHIHLQMRDAAADPRAPEAVGAYDECFAVVRKHGFQGSLSVEFTRGIGRDEEMEELYANACIDLQYCRKALA